MRSVNDLYVYLMLKNLSFQMDVTLEYEWENISELGKWWHINRIEFSVLRAGWSRITGTIQLAQIVFFFVSFCVCVFFLV